LPGSRRVGGKGEHFKLNLGQGNRSFSAIAFRQGEKLGSMNLSGLFQAAFSPEWNDFNGQRNIQLELRDLRPGS
jgi:single-stranded-DNA-specific exonuclease